jgi:B12-binding domain/radical SAM domain protein
MRSETALVFCYTKTNRNSYNALAGALEKYPDIKKINVYFPANEKELFREMPGILRSHQKVIVGISFFTPQFWQVKDLVERLRAGENSSMILLAGGPHATGDPRGTLEIGFDLVIRGEGEVTLIEFLQKINNREDYRDIQGISYRDEYGNDVFTGMREPLNIDHYSPVSGYFSKHGPIEITRGCPFGCSYCQVSHLFGKKPRQRSIENILDCMNVLKRRGASYYRFVSPDAFAYGSEDGKAINDEKLDSLLSAARNLVGKEGKIFFGSFPSEVRPEHVNDETVNIVKKYIDNDNLAIGAQSGSPRMLDLIKRGHDVEAIYKAVDAALKAGLKANVDFIFGLPGETDDDMSSTLTVIKALNQSGAKVHAHTFIPLPQTSFMNERAARISPALRREIERLCSCGMIYGQWRKQGKIAARVADQLFRSGKSDQAFPS